MNCPCEHENIGCEEVCEDMFSPAPKQLTEGDNLFDKLQEVVHVRTGRIYTIYKTPRMSSRLEHSNEMYYQYKGGDNIWWIRCKSEMEDGRFAVK